ncbi:MAG: DUF6884 domain-containing protein [Betaproteobacteria bacterium]
MINGRCYLVSCVSEKRSVAVEARDLYTSTLFTKACAYVEKSGDPWFILSAEHGLVDPAQVIAPYDKTLNKMGVSARRAWAAKVIEQMDSCLPSCKEIVVLAGVEYREYLMDYLRRRATVIVPMEGLTIGRQLSWLDTHSPDAR